MLLPCDNEVFADKGDDSRISIDEGELDALATYLEAVQVFLHQHIHSRKATLLLHQIQPTCTTVTLSALGLRTTNVSRISYETRRGRH